MGTAVIKSILGRVLEQEYVETWFQPIALIRNRSIAGVEALARFIHPDTGDLLPPAPLFHEATRLGLAVEIDRLCRRKALQAFEPLHRAHPELALFLNFDSSIVDKGIVGSGMFHRMIDDLDLDPKNIVIEFVESNVHHEAALRHFVETHRNRGFLIAVDDVGSGYSNLSRISELKPDIIKADRSLVGEIHNQYHKQEVLRALTGLGHRLGAMVVVEGVESEPDALTSLGIGADLVQGFYLASPSRSVDDLLNRILPRVSNLADNSDQYLIECSGIERETEARYYESSDQLVACFMKNGLSDFAHKIQPVFRLDPEIECAYVLNRSGIQISDTVFNPQMKPFGNRFVFHPSAAGADHSHKEYVVRLQTCQDTHCTPPYISLASGGLCRTVSKQLEHPEAGPVILCVDFIQL